MKVLLALLLFAVLAGTVPALAAGEEAQDRPCLGLALGSGGAGGLAHIAMLAVFDELDWHPDRISGTSIGAVIGALYAAGLDAEAIEDIFDDFAGSQLDALSGLLGSSADLGLLDLLRLGWRRGGLIDASGFLDFLKGKIEARDFDDLKIPLRVVATDYWTGEMVVLDRGDLFEAIEASMAVPGLFAPVRQGDKLLIDGGTSNPLPYDILGEDCDVLVAVDVSSNRERSNSEQPAISKMLFSTFEIMQQSLIAARREIHEPDLYINPDTSDIRLLHFNRIETILEQAQPAADELRQALQGVLDR